MHGSQLVEKLVLDSKALGRLEWRKDMAAGTVQALADEASGLKQTIADMIREKKKLRGEPGEKSAGKLPALISRERTFALRGHQRVLRERLRSTNQNRRRMLEETRMIKQQIALLETRVATARSRLVRNPKEKYRPAPA
jgi:hypothetical protein